MDTNTGLKILLVEDNQVLRDLTVELISELGHQVSPVADAETALTSLGEHSFDAVMTDVRLPGKSGLALASEVTVRYSTLPIIICSASTTFSEEMLKRELGIQAVVFLQKPYSFDSLKRALDQVVRFESSSPSDSDDPVDR